MECSLVGGCGETFVGSSQTVKFMEAFSLASSCHGVIYMPGYRQKAEHLSLPLPLNSFISKRLGSLP